MAGATAEEQLYLELINDARLDPLGNAARYILSYTPLGSSDHNIQNALDYFQVNGAALQAAYAALVAVGPVAWNDKLATAAEKHSAAMIAADEQSHQLPGEADLGGRATAEGYAWNGLGENVYAYAESVIYGHAGFMVDWGQGPDGMQSPAGHRINIMRASYREVGIDVTYETNPNTEVGPQVVTQDFGVRNGKYFVLGVAYTDSDANRFYSIGEGRGDLVVSAGAASVASAASGGYSLEAATGAITVNLSGGGLAGTVSVNAVIGPDNLKLDVVNGSTLLASGSVTVTSGAISGLRGLGIKGLSLTTGSGDQTVEGTSGNDTLTGGAGNDTLIGGLGDDIAVYSGSRSDYQVSAEGQGYRLVDLRGGGDGSDLAFGIETFRFADGDRAAASLIVAPPESTPTPTPTPTPTSDFGPPFRLTASLGWAGAIKGNGEITGTNGFQDVTLIEGWGKIVLDGSFSRGGDVVRLPGNASSYTIALAGSSARLIHGGSEIVIPIGTTGLAIEFNDGARELFFDTASNSAKIGTQTIGGAAASISAAVDGSIVPAGADANASARLVLPQSGDVTFAGKAQLFGSNGAEIVRLLDGSISLDGSFARGGDTLHLPGAASDYKAYVTGSAVVLAAGGDLTTIPVGVNGMTLDFLGDDRTLVYDQIDARIEIEGQAITATSLQAAIALQTGAIA